LARLTITSALHRLQPDWSCVEAATFDQALEMLSSEPLDIALIDFNMPGMDGLKLAASPLNNRLTGYSTITKTS
jgi:CheY-like chemotaxis protein